MVLYQSTVAVSIIKMFFLLIGFNLYRAGVLPYYCLSWVITWCSHDLDDLEKITRLFDLFLCSNPFMPVYFAAAVVLSRKKQILALENDISVIHSFLTKLPKDLDVESLCHTACELEEKYSSFELQCQSAIALDEISAINRYEKDWLSIQTQKDLDDLLEDKIIPMLQNKEERKPMELVSISLKNQQYTNSILERLRQVDKKDMAIYTLVTIGAGVGLLALFASNVDLVR